MTLDEFLHELSARRGLHRKIGLVGRYWRQVQALPADKQQQVALALGSKAAWNRLEKLFAKDGTLSDGKLAVKRALDRVGRAEPDELRDLASKVRSGNYADVSRELVEVVGEALDEEADSDEIAGAGEEAAIDDETEPPDAGEANGEPAVDDAEAFHEAPPDSAPASAADPADDDAPHVVEAPVAAAAAVSSPPLPEVVAAPTLPPPPEVVAAPTPSPTPEVVADPTPPPPEAVAAPDTTRAPTLTAAEKLGLLRTLRADPGYGARLGRSGRAQLLARLGSGWATRRALSELIRGQAVEDLDEALRLTGHLHSEVQKTWCLGDLVQYWALDEPELERVLRAARSPATSARLRRRHAR